MAEFALRLPSALNPIVEAVFPPSPDLERSAKRCSAELFRLLELLCGFHPFATFLS